MFFPGNPEEAGPKDNIGQPREKGTLEVKGPAVFTSSLGIMGVTGARSLTG